MFNLIDNDNKYLIINSINPINEMDFKLNDLKSRAKNCLFAVIEKPDDELMFALILKNFSDRQITIDKKLIDFIIKRIDRSYSKIFEFIYKIDELSLKKKKAIDLINQSGNEYDFILLTRFDIAFMVDFDFNKFDVSKFYAQGPPGGFVNGLEMINDLWFFANQDNMSKFSNLYDYLSDEKYQVHIDSNHELARRHLIETGLDNSLEYTFTREWNGAPGKLSTETPLVRWYYMNRV